MTTVRLCLRRDLAKTGEIVIGVLTSSEASADASPEGIEVMPLLEHWGFGALPRLLQAVREWRPDIIHIQYPTRGYGRGKMPLLLPLLLGRTFPVVQTWHEPLSLLRGVRYLPCAIMRDSFVTVEPDVSSFVPGFIRWFLQRKRWFRHIPVGAMIPAVVLDSEERAVLKQEFAPGGRNLLVYFGFAIPSKGIETLFALADPEIDRLVLVCELSQDNDYHRRISTLLAEERWLGKAVVTGYLPGEKVARILAAADAVIFPFTAGMTGRNTSVYAAQAQGTFVLTTSGEKHGYSERENIYYAPPGDFATLRTALRRYAGQRGSGATTTWSSIAAAHLELYRDIMKERSHGD